MANIARETFFEVLSSRFPGASFVHQSKPRDVQQRLVKFKKRFYSKIDEELFEEGRRVFALAPDKFIEQRSQSFLTRLILSQYVLRKELRKALSISPTSRHVFYRVLLSKLSSPFASKRVFGIFVGINFLHKHDIFTEEHLFRALQKLKLGFEQVSESTYSFQRHGEPFKFIYLEVERKEGNAFSLYENRLLRQSLKELLKKSVEKLQPSIFMLNNQEEELKNVLLLSREINSATDLPQVMIHFEEQTDKDVCFRVLFVHSFKKPLALQDFFTLKKIPYLPNWTQIVRYLKKKQPIQAHAFKVYLSKTFDLIRADASLNFYAAREKVHQLLEEGIGEFRDFNGGVILKQGEILGQFKQAFQEHPLELLENFFYSLAPLEIQASIPLTTLGALFELFLEAKIEQFPTQDRFARFLRQNTKTYAMFCSKETSFIKSLQTCLDSLKIDPENLITVHLEEEGRIFWGCAFEANIETEHEAFMRALQQEIDSWTRNLQRLSVLRLAISSDFTLLDPRIQGDEDRKALLKLLFEGLTKIDSSGKVVLGVAEKIKISSDKKRYIFTLRQAQWSNRDPVLAEDFVYAWKTILSPDFKAPFAYLFYPIKNARLIKEGEASPDVFGVRALDAKTLEIELEYPVPYFLELLAQPQFSPIHASIDKNEPTWAHQDGERYVSNGAFTLKKNHLLQSYEFIKNPLYHDKESIGLDKVLIKKASSSEISDLFFRDQVDWVGFPLNTIDSSLALEGEGLILPNDSLYWYVFNTQCIPFNNVKLRSAFALVIDRMQILQALPTGFWPASNLLPFQLSRGDLMEENRQKGIRLFQEALDELGLTRESFPPLKITYMVGNIRNKVAVITKNFWEETFGIPCHLEPENWNEIFSKLTHGNFQICGINWISLIDDPSYNLEIFHSASQFINFPKWKHDGYDKLLKRAQREKQSSKRLHYYALAEAILLQEVPVIPLIRVLPYAVKKDRIEMPIHSSLKVWDFKWATIRND